jgi:hypothetical protein
LIGVSEFRSEYPHFSQSGRSEHETGLTISILDSQLGDGRPIGSFCVYPAVIGLCAPFTFSFGSMFDSLCLMRLRPRRVAALPQDWSAVYLKTWTPW